MSDNIQTNTAGQTPPCLQHQIEKTRYLIENDEYVLDKQQQAVRRYRRASLGVK